MIKTVLSGHKITLFLHTLTLRAPIPTTVCQKSLW